MGYSEIIESLMELKYFLGHDGMIRIPGKVKSWTHTSHRWVAHNQWTQQGVFDEARKLFDHRTTVIGTRKRSSTTGTLSLSNTAMHHLFFCINRCSHLQSNVKKRQDMLWRQTVSWMGYYNPQSLLFSAFQAFLFRYNRQEHWLTSSLFPPLLWPSVWLLF